MTTTRSRPPRGREQARHASGGVAAEHAGKIYAVAITGAVIALAFLTLTQMGHVVDAAVQHFMLYYAGVFALITLCASTGLGFVATDRMVLGPGHRVFLQSAHRAASFGAVTFLIVHIVTEILAQRVHALDAFIPFLSPFRTFYIGLGTIASDLVILLVITGIYRKRFTTNGKAWRWRAIHYTSYAAFVFGVWHGLLGGRPGKPYVDWSYGFLVAVVALALAVRILANSLRPKESLSSPPVSESTGSGSAPMRAASMFAQLGMARAAASGGASGPMTALGGSRGALTASGRNSGAMPVLAALTAPVTAEVVSDPVTGPMPAGDGWTAQWRGEPVYEPGYDGPPRYRGAPRHPGTGPQPRPATGPMPRAASGALPRAASGPMPRAATGPIPRGATGPMPRAATGPMPQAPSGPMPRAGSGPMPRAGSGPMPRAGTGPMPQAPSGPMPRAGSGPMPRAASGPMPRAGTGPMPRAGTGPLPTAASGPWPRAATGPIPRGGPGPRPPAASGPMPRPESGPMPRAASGPMPRPANGPFPPTGPARRPPAPAGPMPGSMPPVRGGGSRGASEGERFVRDMGNGMRPAVGGDPWATGVDPGLRYREPGPGMPGYRGGRPQGDDPYAADPYAAGPYAADHYAPPPPDGNAYGGSGYGGIWYDADPYGWDGRQ